MFKLLKNWSDEKITLWNAQTLKLSWQSLNGSIYNSNKFKSNDWLKTIWIVIMLDLKYWCNLWEWFTRINNSKSKKND